MRKDKTVNSEPASPRSETQTRTEGGGAEGREKNRGEVGGFISDRTYGKGALVPRACRK